jgi:exosortase J
METISTPGELGHQAATVPAWQELALAAMLAFAGLLLCFSQALRDLWFQWSTDPLRSIGMLMPVAALFFAIRNGRREHWQHGSWWGFGLMLLAVALALLTRLTPTLLDLWYKTLLWIRLAPIGLVLWMYCSGAVIFLGGIKSWQIQRFPLALLLLVNPVPRFFNQLVDLPMQTIAAQTARGFASLIAVPVNGNALKMMFAPQLGMFIAPGCDGLRGVSTMACMALIVGYFYRMRPSRHGLYVVSAMALAYLFNLLRLCCVVIYYWFAVRIPLIAGYGTEIDYLIGGTLFFLAALFIFSIPRRGQAI